MELVYLWVEKYNNIEKQGFNFSERFHFKYDEEPNELTYTEYNVFDKPNNNIFINAIAGKNGAGKSTLLILLLGAIYHNGFDTKDANWRKFKKLIFVYLDTNDSFIVYTFNGQGEKGVRFENFTINNWETKNLYQDNDTCIPNEDLSKNYFLLFDFSIGQQDIWNDFVNYKTNFALEPSRIYLGTGGAGLTSKIEPTSFNSTMKSNAVYFYKYIYDNKLGNFLDVFNLPRFDYLHYFGKSNMRQPIRERTFKELQEDAVSSFGIQFDTLKVYEEIDEKVGNYIQNIKPIKDLTEEDLEHYDRILIYSNLEPETSDEKYFWSLSTGQQLLISYLGIIVRTHLKAQKLKKKIFNIFIDEIETSLHPDWQRKSLQFFIEFLTKSEINTGYERINILASTHSPFILSDLQKSNIVFLNDGKQVYPFKDGQETFGANIHTLLSHGFFMEGMIGELAKTKIDKVITYLNQKTLTTEEIEYCENIISIIGEPILKRQLQKMLDSKRISRIDEIDELKRRIALLESKR